MPRGRPIRKTDAVASSPGGGTHPSPPGVIETAGIDIPLIDIPGLPPSKVKGEWNPDYFASMLDVANKRVMSALLNGDKIDFPYAQFQKGVIDAAKMVGVTEREILDRRTPEQRAEDVWEKVCADPESMFGIKDEDLKALDGVLARVEEMMNNADGLCHQVLEEILQKNDDERDARAPRGAEGRRVIEENRSPKAWRRRISRILRLRERAKFPVPKNGSGDLAGSWTGNQHTEKNRPGLIPQALEAAHLLRFMVYVGRVGMDTTEKFSRDEKSPADLIFDVSYHHAKFAATLWIHRNGAHPTYSKDSGKHFYRMGVVHYEGSIQIMPIGHGKSELAIHWTGLEIGLHPRDPGAVIHAKAEMAESNLSAVKRFFNPDDGIGERYLAIFPLRLTKYQNTQKRIRVDVKNPPKSPTWIAAGVDSSSLGIDADKQVWDDVVPQSDAEQPTERERRGRILAGTFSSRKRSKKAFTLVIGNLWHYGDAVMKMIQEAKSGKLMYGVTIQRCGGPKATSTTKAWQPLWPKMYTPDRLKQKYVELTPSPYSAAMMCNPLADEQRIVKKIRFYDPLSPEHESFMASSLKYISLDPAATNSRGSDKAGVVYAGVGDVRIHGTDADGNRTTGSERRVRFLDCHEIHATQSELTEYTTSFAATKQVDYVIVEAVSGFRGIVEMFEGRGIDAIRVNPRGKNKEQRLRAVAPFIEDASANLGIRAIAEFPGVWEGEGEKRRLMADPRFKTVIEQILDFGVCDGDHIVDAVTYLLGYVSSDLSIGRGIVTDKVRFMKPVLDEQRQRLLSMYEAYERADKLRRSGGGTSEEAEDKWMRQDFQ
jgi:hypothetical protein